MKKLRNPKAQGKRMPQKKVHYGERLKVVMLHFNEIQEEFAKRLGVAQSTVNRWTQKEDFSALILAKIGKLKKNGINPDFFRREDAPMLLSDVPETPSGDKETEKLRAEYRSLIEELKGIRDSLKKS